MNNNGLNSLFTFLNKLTPVTATTKELVASLFTQTTLSKGSYFIKEGQLAREIGFLHTGVVRAFYSGNKGFDYNKHFFTAPSFIGGYASLITGMPNQIQQQALTDCEILTAPYNSFRALFDECPDLERAARILAEQFFVQKEQREIDLVLLDADERYRKFQQAYFELETILPQYHIASYLGITATQLSRIRRKFAGR
ncbi:MAG: Crp/Fnr family transcriptional regulator [Chitinophagaceae bacterium]|jgi:CRP-like cAMP-binding protein|nr:Crp/Fnr family transcriptional regulator [Chitinophagaceae bacterium]